MKDIKWYHFWNPWSGLRGGLIFGLIITACLVGAFIYHDIESVNETEPDKYKIVLDTVVSLQKHVTTVQDAVIFLQEREYENIIEISGLNDEILELRQITDEFRAQIKGLQKEVLIGIQEGGM